MFPTVPTYHLIPLRFPSAALVAVARPDGRVVAFLSRAEAEAFLAEHAGCRCYRNAA